MSNDYSASASSTSLRFLDANADVEARWRRAWRDYARVTGARLDWGQLEAVLQAQYRAQGVL